MCVWRVMGSVREHVCNSIRYIRYTNIHKRTPYKYYFYRHRLVPHIGATQDLPAKSCKEIRDVRPNECDCTLSSGMYWVNHTDPCMKLPPKVIKVSDLNCSAVQ